jgi:DNA-binding response OmpR family regulator
MPIEIQVLEDPASLFRLNSILTREGFDVSGFTDLDEFLSSLRTRRQVDASIIPLVSSQLSIYNGVFRNLTRRLSEFGDFPILCTSPLPSEYAARQVIGDNQVGLIPKPFVPQVVISQVRKYVQKTPSGIAIPERYSII